MRADPDGAGAPDTGVQVALLAASAAAPGTFAPSLAARTALDQGLVTALSTSLHYLLTLGVQDAVQALAANAATASGRSPAEQAARQRVLTVVADLACVPLGIAVGRALPARPGEPVVRGLVRQAGWRFAVTGLGASLLTAARSAATAADARLGAHGRLAAVPLAVPLGLAVAAVVEHRRARDEEQEAAPAGTPSPVQSAALAAATVGGLAGVAYGEHVLATALGRRLARALPGDPELWRLVGHATSLGALAVSVSALWGRAMRRIEAGTAHDAPLFATDEAARLTGATMSGGPGSLVPWSTLGREGRRHALTHVRPHPVRDRPPGVPDLSIETVMGEAARATPVQVYVGLDSAPTARQRVDLALAELERTGAFDRSLLVLVSPTGTGYVNYVAAAAAQYLSRGDVATVTLQYAKRPSPLSLGMVAAAREQNRSLWLRILERLRTRTTRPRVVVFGESLGAHTSQDVFLHWGTLGPRALGIDRALWIGTPYGSGWARELTAPGRLDVEDDLVAVVNDYEQLRDRARERGATPPYVLLSHDNDGVTKFGLDLLATAPAWLGPDRPGVEAVPGRSPRGISAAMRWRPLTTCFQLLVDMKNAQVAGPYQAWAHDYRPDLPRFVSDVFDLPASPEQLAAVEAAVQHREHAREELFSRSLHTVR